MIKKIKKYLDKKQQKKIKRNLRQSDKQRLFTTEEILGHCSLGVQNLLSGYANKKSYQEIINQIGLKLPYLKLSNSKTKQQGYLVFGRTMKQAKFYLKGKRAL